VLVVVRGCVDSSLWHSHLTHPQIRSPTFRYTAQHTPPRSWRGYPLEHHFDLGASTSTSSLRCHCSKQAHHAIMRKSPWGDRIGWNHLPPLVHIPYRSPRSSPLPSRLRGWGNRSTSPHLVASLATPPPLLSAADTLQVPSNSNSNSSSLHAALLCRIHPPRF
jgi:hypothetical protein